MWHYYFLVLFFFLPALAFADLLDSSPFDLDSSHVLLGEDSEEALRVRDKRALVSVPLINPWMSDVRMVLARIKEDQGKKLLIYCKPVIL